MPGWFLGRFFRLGRALIGQGLGGHLPPVYVDAPILSVQAAGDTAGSIGAAGDTTITVTSPGDTVGTIEAGVNN